MASLGSGLFRLGKRTSWVAALTRNLYVLWSRFLARLPAVLLTCRNYATAW